MILKYYTKSQLTGKCSIVVLEWQNHGHVRSGSWRLVCSGFCLDKHIESRYMGMHKTLKMYIFAIEYGIDIIPVSFYSLNSELSFDTQHFMFIHFRNGQNIKNRYFSHLIDLQRSQKVKSEVAPDLKMTFRVYANYIPSFMLLSQSAQIKCLGALQSMCIV